MWLAVLLACILALLATGCGDSGDKTATPTVPVGLATSTPAEPTATAGVTWPEPLGLAPVDSALTSIRTGDPAALVALVQQASGPCTTARGVAGALLCPVGVADGTEVQYFPYLECDVWGTPEAVVNRLIGQTTYPLAVVAWDQPVASPAGAVLDHEITHTVLLAGPTTAGDARILTTLAFDGEKLREIVGDCGVHSQAAFESGELPGVGPEADVLWRAYPP